MLRFICIFLVIKFPSLIRICQYWGSYHLTFLFVYLFIRFEKGLCSQFLYFSLLNVEITGMWFPFIGTPGFSLPFLPISLFCLVSETVASYSPSCPWAHNPSVLASLCRTLSVCYHKQFIALIFNAFEAQVSLPIFLWLSRLLSFTCSILLIRLLLKLLLFIESFLFCILDFMIMFKCYPLFLRWYKCCPKMFCGLIILSNFFLLEIYFHGLYWVV